MQRLTHPHPGWAVLFLMLALSGCDSTSVDAPDLDAPFLLRPLDAAAAEVGTPVVLSWQPVDGAARYKCEIRRADEENPSVEIEFTTATEVTLTFDVPGVYSWRIRALDEDDASGYWSETWEFLVQPTFDP